MYNELIEISQIQGKPRTRYSRMLSLLRRICIEQSINFKGDYATLFSLLVAVCQHLHIDHRPADRFRHRARLILSEDFEPTAEEEQADLADLAHFIHQVSGKPIPHPLPQHIRPLRITNTHQSPYRKNLRGVVLKIISNYSFTFQAEGEQFAYTVKFNEQKDTTAENYQNTRYIYKGANVMLLDAEADTHAADTLLIYMAILEPDYLIDVSALTATMKPYGASPLNYLINSLQPNTTTRHTLLGNLANQYMDDCINDSSNEDLYSRSTLKNFRQNLLEYACMSDVELSNQFFAQSKIQFNHINQIVHHYFTGTDIDIASSKVLLEPSFISPNLGLRGRLDVMTMDFMRILELKSGKAKESYQTPVGPKPEHLLQMTLYGEILRRNFNISWNDVRTFLVYSTYPIFYNERPSAAAIRNILNLRNGIINLNYQLRQGRFESILKLLTPEHLKQFIVPDNFYKKYILPQLKAVTNPLADLQADPLLRSYFSVFLTFVEREMFMSKTSDNRPDSLRGFAATWTADLQTKLTAGNILTRLSILKTETDNENSIAKICLKIPPYDGEFVPNFNKGELIQLYEAEDKSDNVTNHLLIKGTVAAITANTITIELNYHQRNHNLFSTSRHYAVEHDTIDSPSAQQKRNLFALLLTNSKRRNLLLGREAPTANTERTLIGNYPESVRNIVLQAKQANDYYLLVGPPGTGKTNLALRSMVMEFLLSNGYKTTQQASSNSSASSNSDKGLLLTAYTNRAVDEICSMLNSLSQEIAFDYLRIGSTQTCDKAHTSHLLCKRAETLNNRIQAKQLIQHTPIFVGTVLTLTRQQILFKLKHFDTAIIDEASQLLEPQALGLFCAQVDKKDAIDKFILIGDHKQLPAVVMLPEEQTQVTEPCLLSMGLSNLRNSLFERLHRMEQQQGRTAFVGLLNRQGRMHPDICQFVNEHFYEHKLTEVPLPHQREELQWTNASTPYEKFVASTRMGFIPVCQVANVENLRANAPEAEAVCNIVQAICSLHEKNGQTSFIPHKAIGVIVPFRSQIASIRSILRKHGFTWADDVTIDTIECYQGSQRDYILFSSTISQPYQLNLLSSIQRIGKAQVDRKLNVAITRARRQFFIFGNPQLLRKNAVYSALIDACDVMH